jgi:hypothetical protein
MGEISFAVFQTLKLLIFDSRVLRMLATHCA